MTRLGAAMSRRGTLALAGASLLAAALPAAASPARCVRRSSPSRGFNLPGWFDREDGIAPSARVLEALRRRGFRTIRLPVDGDQMPQSGAADRRMRGGISGLIDAGFCVLVDMHPSADLHAAFRKDPPAAAERVVSAWTPLRAVIADLPEDRVFPELLNEPPMERGAWLSLRDRLAGIVRAACPRHTLVWGPAPDQGIWQLEDTPPLADDNQIAAVHFYAPMALTHQCQSWGTSSLAHVSGLPFPAGRTEPRVQQRLAALRASGDGSAAALVEEQLATPWTEAAIGAQFQDAARWSDRTGCPVILNEFGVLGDCVDPRSRAAWIGAVRRAAEANGIGWTYWELDQGFGFIRSRLSTEGFDGGMLDALFGGED